MITEKQQLALRLCRERGWGVQRIAKKLGIRKSAASRLLSRVKARAGLKRPDSPAPKTRFVRAISLSAVFDA